MIVNQEPKRQEKSERCQVCGGIVHVRFLKGYRDGKPVVDRFCFKCVDEQPEHLLVNDRKPVCGRLNFGSMEIFVGLLMIALGIGGDYLGISGSIGFGWYQQLGVVLGVLFLALGTIFQIEFIFFSGTVIFVLSAFADVFSLSGQGGIGWKQQLVVFAGLATMLLGLWLRRWLMKRRSVL